MNDGDSSVERVLAKRHGLADGDAVGDVVVVEQFPGADPQDDAVHGGHPLQGPALRIGFQELVDRHLVGDNAFDDFEGVRVDDLVRLLPAGLQHIERRDGTLFRLEENIQGPVTGLTACTH